MKIRRYKIGEEEYLWSLLYETVHNINIKDYSQTQVEAWAPASIDMEKWRTRLKKSNPFVAEANGVIIGFAELEDNGHINCFYSAHDWQSKGVGSNLLHAIEQDAVQRGIAKLFIEASITARNYFLGKGFTSGKKQTVALRGQQFTNYAMSKRLRKLPSPQKYVAPLRFHWLTPYYDSIARLTIREYRVKHALIEQAQVEAGQQVLDLGCGTGTLAMWIKQQHPLTRVTGVDCDLAILAAATAKTKRALVHVEFVQALSYHLPYKEEHFDRVVSSLFFHHLTWDNKKRTTREIYRILKPGAQLHIADWGRPSNLLMHCLFLPVQLFDGIDCTRDNVAGKIPLLLVDSGFTDVAVQQTFSTVFGTMTLYSARKPEK